MLLLQKKEGKQHEMNEICSRIVKGITLSVEQADEVCRCLDQLEETSVWDVPDWARDLEKHYQICGAAHPVILSAGWRAAAKAYQRFVQLQIAVSKRKSR